MHSFKETLHMVGTTHSDLIVCSGCRELGLTDSLVDSWDVVYG